MWPVERHAQETLTDETKGIGHNNAHPTLAGHTAQPPCYSNLFGGVRV